MAFVPLVSIPIQLQDSTTSVNMSGGSLEFFLSGSSTPTNLFSDNVGTSIGTSIGLNSGGYPESNGNVITLFRDSSIALKIIGKDAAGIPRWTSDGLKDSLVILASVANGEGASLVGSEDAGGYFAGADQEAINQDIGANYLKNTVNRTGITATYTFASGGVIAMADQEIRRAVFVDYAIKHTTLTQTSGTVDLDMEGFNSFEFVLTENATITISNPPASNYGQLVVVIVQDGSGGAFTVTWPAAVTWPSATAPTMTVTNDAEDEFTLRTRDTGTVWKGSFSQAFG
jgi:hypothetical protein